jgi:hypothetical protein
MRSTVLVLVGVLVSAVAFASVLTALVMPDYAVPDHVAAPEHTKRWSFLWINPTGPMQIRDVVDCPSCERIHWLRSPWVSVEQRGNKLLVTVHDDRRVRVVHQ